MRSGQRQERGTQQVPGGSQGERAWRSRRMSYTEKHGAGVASRRAGGGKKTDSKVAGPGRSGNQHSLPGSRPESEASTAACEKDRRGRPPPLSRERVYLSNRASPQVRAHPPRALGTWPRRSDSLEIKNQKISGAEVSVPVDKDWAADYDS